MKRYKAAFVIVLLASALLLMGATVRSYRGTGLDTANSFDFNLGDNDVILDTRGINGCAVTIRVATLTGTAPVK